MKNEAITLDSLKERILSSYDLLPEYYLRFDISGFALHQNDLQKREFLAQPHPQLEFCFISYKDLIASVWNVDFLFGLGELPDDNVFTVLNVAFGIDPAIELRLKKLIISSGIAHRCIHGVDRKEFPVVYYNRIFLSGSSKNYRLNAYYQQMQTDSAFSIKKRFAWSAQFSYYLKEFFNLASPDKLNGENPDIWDVGCSIRYSFCKRKSWIVAITSESTYGIFDPSEGFHSYSGLDWYGTQVFGIKAFFSRGTRGACFYTDYYLDKLPVPVEQPSFAKGRSRFSKNGMLQIGLIFFN